MANVWGKKNAWRTNADEEEEEPIVSFVEIMSEELVNNLADEEAGIMGMSPSTTAYMDDEEMARALQREFDREAEMADLLEQSKRTPGKHNTVSMAADRYCPTSRQWKGDGEIDEADSDDEELRELSTGQMYEKMDAVLGPMIGGLFRSPNGEVICKHDPSIASSKNVERVMNGVIDIPTGDCYSVEVNSGGNVFNKLRSFSKTEQKRVARLKDKEEKATIETSVDNITRLTLFKWINQGLFDRVEGIIATGKESAVISACANSTPITDNPVYFAIKVFKTSLVEFKNRAEYVVNDFRFKNPRRVMRIWAEKEFMNLTRMFNKQLPCPEPIKLKKHILMMSLIGDENGLAAPKLKIVQFEDENEVESAFQQTKEIVHRMFRDCSLVHGDLSEFNLLWKDGRVFVIDVSQAMDLSHPRVLNYLLRDIDNVLSFFSRLGVRELPSRTAFFNSVTDLTMSDDDDLNVQVEDFEAVNRNIQLRMDKNKPADMDLRKLHEEMRGLEDPSYSYS